MFVLDDVDKELKQVCEVYRILLIGGDVQVRF